MALLSTPLHTQVQHRSDIEMKKTPPGQSGTQKGASDEAHRHLRAPPQQDMKNPMQVTKSRLSRHIPQGRDRIARNLLMCSYRNQAGPRLGGDAGRYIDERRQNVYHTCAADKRGTPRSLNACQIACPVSLLPGVHLPEPNNHRAGSRQQLVGREKSSAYTLAGSLHFVETANRAPKPR